MINRIENNMPLQYVIGDVTFCNLPFQVRPPVLIPRPETEQIVSWLIHYLTLVDKWQNSANLHAVIKKPHSLQQLCLSNHSNSKQIVIFGIAGDNISYFGAEDTIPNKDTNYFEQISLRKYPIHEFQMEWLDTVYPFDEHHGTWSKQMSGNRHSMFSRNSSQQLNILDVCTGSGNIATSLTFHIPSANVVGVDLAEEALSLSQDNRDAIDSQFGGDELKNRLLFHAADVFSDTRSNPEASSQAIGGILDTMFILKDLLGKQQGRCTDMDLIDNGNDEHTRFDILVSNPPYIPLTEYLELESDVVKWEDRNALVPNINPSSSEIRRQPILWNSDCKNLLETTKVRRDDSTSSVTSELKHQEAPSIWPEKKIVDELAVGFYERLISLSHHMLTNLDDTMSTSNTEKFLLYPQLVFEIGGQSQSTVICDMLAEKNYYPHIFKDAYGKHRWIVGFSPRNMPACVAK